MGPVAVLLVVLVSVSGRAEAADVTGTITPGGSPVTVTLVSSGDVARLTFEGTVGQRVFLKVSGVSLSSGIALKVDILKPDGSSLGGTGFVFNNGTKFIDTKTLPTAGTYTVLVDPYQDTTGTATVTLYDVPADVTGPITAGGSAVSVTNSTPGQDGRLTFSATAGQRVFVNALTSGLTSAGGTAAATVSLLKPDGSSLGSSGFVFNNSYGFIDTKTLASTGTYTLLLDSYENTTGTTTVTLYDVPADLTGAITAGGSPVSAAIATSGQNGRFTFSGAAGQRVLLEMATGSLAAAGTAAVMVQILKPDGSSLGSTGYVFGNGAKVIDTKTLPTTGTYTVLVDPNQDTTGTTTVTLYDVPPDLTDAIAISGPAVGISLAMGQNAALPFSGAAGQTVRFARSLITIEYAYYKIVKPDGSTLVSSGFTGMGNATLDADLPVTGQYTLLVDPFENRTGSATLALAIRGDAPYDGADVSSCGTTPVFRAQPVAGATQYQFQVASDAGFTTVVSDSGLRPATNTFTPAAGALASGSSYHWRWKTSTGAWSTGRSFTTNLPKLGARESSAVWSLGPLAVNQVNGNLLAGLPGPSYPTATGAIGASLAYNSLDTQNRGLGAGWLLDAGAGEAGAPVLLLDHNLLTGGVRLDAVEAVYADGSSTCFTHVAETATYVAAPGDGQLLSKNADGSWTLVAGETIASFSVANGATGIGSLTGVESSGAAAGNGKLSYAYSIADPSKVASVTDGAGRSLTFTWSALNPAGCTAAIVCLTGPDGVTWRYVGDTGGGTGGKLIRVNNGSRDLAQIGYDSSNRLNKLQNANDLNPTAASPGYDGTHSLSVAYGGTGKVASISEGPVTGQTPATATWSFGYFPGTVSTSATRAAHDGMTLGTVRTADGYTTVTPPRQQGQPTPKSTKTYYDNLGHPIELVDLLGNRTLAHYNAREQLLWTEDEDGNPTDSSWDAVNDVLLTTTGTDPDGAGPLGRPVVTNRFDETQIGTSTTAGAALEGVQAAYFANANLAGRPAKRQTDASVDFDWGSGGPAALGSQTDNFSVRWTGNILLTTAGSYSFSTRADDGTRLTIDGIVAVDNWKDQTVATVSSQPITLVVGLHKLVLEYYDRSGPAEVELRYSCTGCSPALADQVVPASALRPAWLNQTSTVSPLGRVGFQHYPDSASGLADYSLTKLDDGTNILTSFTYDSYGRVTRKVMPKGNATRTIDTGGNLQGSPNLDYATDWTYYSPTETAAPPTACGGGSAVNQGELPKTVTPHGIATTTTVFDSAGWPIASTNGKGTSCSSYDTEGRLTNAKAPGDTQATTYSYDPAGQTRAVTDATGTITNEYDEAGRVKKSTDSFGAEASFAYDSEGNLTSRTAAAGALASSTNYTTGYAYDEEGALTSLTDPAGRAYSFHYDPRGQLKATQYPNGTYAWNDYNAAGALTGLYNRHGTLTTPLPASVPADASPLIDYSYTYELEGRKTQELRGGGGLTTETTGYVYDELGRLKTATLPSGVTRTYSFDLDSNRTQIVENGSTVASYSYDPASTAGVDQLTSVTEAGSTRTFAYNGDGETTSYGDKTLNWDGWGRHTGGTFAGQTVSYEFDPTGFRRKRTSGPQITRYLHGGVFETDNAGTITLADVDGPAGDVAHYAGPPSTGSSVSFLYYNGHGDLAAEAESTGSRTGTYTYDPFGSPLQTISASVTAERWTGRWEKKRDTSSSLVEMGVRPYDPQVGRFLSPDPVEGGSFNLYDYAFQDPINVFDLDGRAASRAPRPVYSFKVILQSSNRVDVGHAFSFTLDKYILGGKRRSPKSRDPNARPGYVQFEVAGTVDVRVRGRKIARLSGCFEIGGHLYGKKSFLFVTHRFFNTARPRC